MSMESAKSFAEKVKTDAAFGEKFKATKSVSEIVKKAAELGCSFTKQEIDSALERLTDAELTFISGGHGPIPEQCQKSYRDYV